MRPLKRQGRRSQHCGPTDNPKDSELFHDRTSILIIVRLMNTTRSTVRSVCPQTETRRYTSTESALCQSFLLATLGHAGPIQMDLGVTPLMYRISRGQAVALLNGRRACRADLNVGNRASDGGCGEQKSRDDRCQPELQMSQLQGLRRRQKRVCDRNHILVA